MTDNNPPIAFFAQVSDPRVKRTQKHSLDSILFISLCAVICGAESWNEIEDYGNAKIDWLEKSLIKKTSRLERLARKRVIILQAIKLMPNTLTTQPELTGALKSTALDT